MTRKTPPKVSKINFPKPTSLRLLNFVLLFALIGSLFLHFTLAATAGYLYNGGETVHVSRINQHRANTGRGALTWSGCLTNAAREHAKTMSDANYLYHSSLANIITKHCGNYGYGASENVGGFHSNSSSAMDQYIASAGHRANIEGNYSHVGTGVWKRADGTESSVHIFALQGNGAYGTFNQAVNTNPSPAYASNTAPEPPPVPANVGPFGPAITDATGRIHIFVRGSSGEPFVRAQAGANQPNTWGPYYPMKGLITSDIAAAKHKDGKIQIFARGTNNALFTNSQTCTTCGFGGWVSLGGNLASDPTAVTGSDGRVRVFYRGSDRATWVLAQTAENNGSSWTPHYSLGGIATSNVTATKLKDGRMIIFARGNDNAGWYYPTNADNTFSVGWRSLGGLLTSDITAMQYPDGRMHVFARGTDNQPYVLAQYDTANALSWTTWYGMGGLVSSNISAAKQLDGRIVIFARGTNGALFANGQTCTTCGFGGWSSLGGVLTTDPTSVTMPDGRIQIFARGNPDGAFVMTQSSANGSFPVGIYQGLGGGLSPQSALNVIAGQR